MRVIEAGAIPAGVELADFKKSVHIMAGDTGDDDALQLVLDAAESTVATATGCPLTTRAVEFVVTRGSWCRWWFPALPVQELVALAIDDGGGGWVDQPLDGAWLQQGHDEPQLVLGSAWVGHSVSGDLLRVQARVGGPDPEKRNRLRQAVFLLAKEWFEAGIALEGQDTPRMSFGLHRILKQARYRRPQEFA